jgi:hypothetical protein
MLTNFPHHVLGAITADRPTTAPDGSEGVINWGPSAWRLKRSNYAGDSTQNSIVIDDQRRPLSNAL